MKIQNFYFARKDISKISTQTIAFHSAHSLSIPFNPKSTQIITMSSVLFMEQAFIDYFSSLTGAPLFSEFLVNFLVFFIGGCTYYFILAGFSYYYFYVKYKDYYAPDVSDKVLKIIFSYSKFIKRRVWGINE